MAGAHCCTGTGMAPDDGSPTPGWQARRPMQFKAANVIDLATAIDRPEGLPARRIRLGALKGSLSSNGDA